LSGHARQDELGMCALERKLSSACHEKEW